MVHTICATLVLILALAELAVIRQWAQQHASAGAQQAVAVANFKVPYQRSN
jgi:hypothetical protein